MLYEEFIEGTGCRDNSDNFKIYKDLEIIYMNSDISKQEIYEYGKKLVNNDLTEKQKDWNRQMDEAIEDLRSRMEDWKDMLSRDEETRDYWKRQGEEFKDLYKRYREDVRIDKDEIRRIKIEINKYKSCKYV